MAGGARTGAQNGTLPKVGYKWVSDNCLELSFDTAWDPPISAYDAAVAVHGFELVAFYNEPKYGFLWRICTEQKRAFTSTMMTKFRPILMRCLPSSNGNGNGNRRHGNGNRRTRNPPA